MEPYLLQCRARIPAFVQAHYGVQGSIRLNKKAWGRDIVIAPFNVLMGLPNFIFMLLAMLCSLLRLTRLSQLLSRVNFSFETSVQRDLRQALTSEFFSLQTLPAADAEKWSALIEQPLSAYVKTRNVASDVTAGTLTALTGVALFDQFTPGSVSAGSVVSDWAAQELATSNFLLGDTLGGAWYNIFPASTPLWLLITAFVAVTLIMAVGSAFSGFLHDPIQNWTGIHQRRLNKCLQAIDIKAKQADSLGYQPKDSFVGRIYDVIDWVKGILV